MVYCFWNSWFWERIKTSEGSLSVHIHTYEHTALRLPCGNNSQREKLIQTFLTAVSQKIHREREFENETPLKARREELKGANFFCNFYLKESVPYKKKPEKKVSFSHTSERIQYVSFTQCCILQMLYPLLFCFKNPRLFPYLYVGMCHMCHVWHCVPSMFDS